MHAQHKTKWVLQLTLKGYRKLSDLIVIESHGLGTVIDEAPWIDISEETQIYDEDS